MVCHFLEDELVEATLVDYYALGHVLDIGYSSLLVCGFTVELDVATWEGFELYCFAPAGIVVVETFDVSRS